MGDDGRRCRRVARAMVHRPTTPPPAMLLESGVVMRARYLRAIFSLALCCWFGFVACLLGCAQPALLVPQPQSAHVPHEQLAPAGSDSADRRSCCNHGRNRSGGPRQNQHQGQSCCPLDATLLLQKQDVVGVARAGAPPAGLPPFVLPSLNALAAGGEIPPPTVSAGRDILLQAHVLRI